MGRTLKVGWGGQGWLLIPPKYVIKQTDFIRCVVMWSGMEDSEDPQVQVSDEVMLFSLKAITHQVHSVSGWRNRRKGETEN